MNELYQVLLQNVDEGNWEYFDEGTKEHCESIVEQIENDPEMEGTYMNSRIVKIEPINSKDISTICKAVYEYFNNMMIDVPFGDHELMKKYIEEQRSLMDKLERLVK